MKKVDNLKHFPLHVGMDYNPNLIKALHDSLVALGFTLGQPASQSCRTCGWQQEGDAPVISCSHVSSPKTKDTTEPQMCSSPGVLSSSAPDFE